MKQQRPDRRNSSGGFTLAVLLVVLAIAALLVSVAIPGFSASRARAEAASELTNARAVHEGCMLRLLEGEIDGLLPEEVSYLDKSYLWYYNEIEGEARPYVTVSESGMIYPFDVGQGLYSPVD